MNLTPTRRDFVRCASFVALGHATYANTASATQHTTDSSTTPPPSDPARIDINGVAVTVESARFEREITFLARDPAKPSLYDRLVVYGKVVGTSATRAEIEQWLGRLKVLDYKPRSPFVPDVHAYRQCLLDSLDVRDADDRNAFHVTLSITLVRHHAWETRRG